MADGPTFIAPASSSTTPGTGVPLPYVVERSLRETRETRTLTVTPVEAPIAESAPGQFCMLLAPKAGEVPITISNLSANRLDFTIRNVGAVTRHLVETRCGDIIGLRGPFGTAWPLEAMTGHDILFIAGGLGIAPLRRSILWVLRHRKRFGKLALLLGARTPQDLVFKTHLRRWIHRRDLLTLLSVDHLPYDSTAQSSISQGNTLAWPHHIGIVSDLLKFVGPLSSPTSVLMCGPEVMLRVTAMALMQGGITPSNIYVALERSMACGFGNCGHCQLGPFFICRDGSVMPWSQVGHLLRVARL